MRICKAINDYIQLDEMTYVQMNVDFVWEEIRMGLEREHRLKDENSKENV